MDSESYRTIEGRAQAEIVEKKSRFIGHLCHVETEEEAVGFLNEIRAEHLMARHNVYAYVLRSGRIRYSDDGEPAQTAGMPSLDVLLHGDLQDVALVTTRYFGGILLGTGGLVRAYTSAAQAAIEAAHVVVITRCVDLVIELPYALYEQAQRLVDGETAKVWDTDFGAQVLLTVRARAGTEGTLIKALTELTHGSCEIMVEGPFDAAF